MIETADALAARIIATALWPRDEQSITDWLYENVKLDAKSQSNKLLFQFAGGSNIDPAKDMHMHEGSITIVDDDHIEWSWQGYANGQRAEGHGVTMKLVRKK